MRRKESSGGVVESASSRAAFRGRPVVTDKVVILHIRLWCEKPILVKRRYLLGDTRFYSIGKYATAEKSLNPLRNRNV